MNKIFIFLRIFSFNLYTIISFVKKTVLRPALAERMLGIVLFYHPAQVPVLELELELEPEPEPVT